jgi:hypothetical protein
MCLFVQIFILQRSLAVPAVNKKKLKNTCNADQESPKVIFRG